MNPEQLLQNFDRLIDTPDAVPRLRRFILDLAVRGKLVPQYPEDEPAAEVLKRIEAEKKRLNRERNLPRSKHLLTKNADCIPCDIPANWEWCSLAEITLRIHYGYTASADKNLQRVRLLRITDIQNNEEPSEKVSSLREFQ